MKRYGGAGIKVDEKWVKSFLSFYKDMGPRPSNKHTLDRIDNNRGYSAENCRWATRKEQANNRKNNKIIRFNGVDKSLAEWEKHTGLLAGTIWNRLDRGWSIEDALTLAPFSRGTRYRLAAGLSSERQLKEVERGVEG
jgi:hypothetical protein